MLALGLWITAAVAGELQDTVNEMVPVVERIAGKRFKSIPEVVLADNATFAQVLLEEQMLLLQHTQGIGEQEAFTLASATALDMSDRFAGKYGFLSGKLYLSARGVLQAAGPHSKENVLKLIVVHELTHALQDQHVGLKNLIVNIDDADAIMAANCMVEGQAMWVQAEYADQVDHQREALALEEMVGIHDDSPEAFQSRYVYGGGKAFATYHALFGTDHMWQVLAHPPISTYIVAHPESYERPWPTAPSSVVSMIARSSAKIGPNALRSAGPVGDYDLSEQMVRSSVRANLSQEVLWSWRTKRGQDDNVLQMSWLRFFDDEAASNYVVSLGQRAQEEAQSNRTNPYVLGTATPYSLVEESEGFIETVTLNLPNSASQFMGTVWVAQGQDVVQVMWLNHPPKPAKLKRELRRLLRTRPARQFAPEARSVAFVDTP